MHPLRVLSSAAVSSSDASKQPASPHHPDLSLLNSKRVKGFGRKITLRAINRNLVRRLAKRATIGIPLIGMYFALRVLYNDSLQALSPENTPFIRKAYGTAAAVDISDVAAQSVIIAGMASSFFFADYNLLPVLAELGPVADKVSLSAALVSSCIGTYCEVHKEEAAAAEAAGIEQEGS